MCCVSAAAAGAPPPSLPRPTAQQRGGGGGGGGAAVRSAGRQCFGDGRRGRVVRVAPGASAGACVGDCAGAAAAVPCCHERVVQLRAVLHVPRAMWSGRVTRWRRWPLVAAVLLTVAAGALLSGPWTAPGSDLGDLTWTAAAPPERLEFYGAARNLFSSNSRPVSPSPLAPSPLSLTMSQAPPPVPASSAPEIPASEVTAAPLSPSQTTEPTTTNATPTEQGIDRFDYELDRVKPGDVLPLTETWLRERESRYDARRRRLKRACEKHHVRLMQRTTERSVMPVRDDDTGEFREVPTSPSPVS